MRNLIEQSKQKSTTYFTIIDGVHVANYDTIIAKKQVGEKKYYWHIQRALEGRNTKHYICCEVISNYLETRRARIYSSTIEFENAIKRIQKQIN